MGTQPADAEAWLGQLPHGVAALQPVRDDTGQVVDFRYDYVNAKVAQIFGYQQAAMEGRLLTEVHRWPEVGVAIEQLAFVLDTEAGGVVDLLRSGGGTVVVSLTRVGSRLIAAVRDPRDDVGRNRALGELLDSVERSADFVAIFDPVASQATGELVDFRIRSINDAALQRLGLVRETAVGGLLREVLPGMTERIRTGLEHVARTGQPFIAEDIVGAAHYVGSMRVAATPFEGGIILTSRDTSAEHRTREALATSEAQFRATLEALHEAIFVVSPVRDDHDAVVDLRIELVNEAAVRLVGLTREQVVGRPIDELFPGRPRADLDRCIEVLETGRPGVLDVVSRDASDMRAFEARVARFGDGLVAAVQDVTAQRRAAEQLADSERRYRLLADNAGDVVLLARNGRTEWIAPSVEQLVGYTPEELAELPLTDWVHPDDAPAVLDAALSLAETGSGRARLRARHRDGSIVWVEALLRAIPDFDDAGGAVVATVWNAQAQVEAEQELERAEQARRAQEDRIHQATRLESLGVMAGGIAHDFNNLLVGVLGNAEMALHTLARARDTGSVEPVDAAADLIGNVVLAAHRAAELTRQLLDYAGRRPRDREPVDLHELLAQLPGLVAPRMGATTELQVHVGDGPFVVVGDHGQLQQVLMNLVINAADALVDEPGRVTVRLDRKVLDPADVTDWVAPDCAEPRGCVVLEVTDDGAGIDPGALGRIFEPLFTTRAGGRGLGLAVVHGIVRSHGGRITAASRQGVGTTMTVVLPATDRVVGASTPGSTVHGLMTAPLVLVIDDDDQVAEVSSLVLRSGGFAVEVETDPARALQRFRERPAAYGAVLLDLTMPTIPGDQVLADLGAIDPAVPVVVVSGYADAEMEARLADLGVSAFVHKPYRAGELLTAVVAVVRPASTSD